MTHLKDNTKAELDKILTKLAKNKIPYKMLRKNNLIVELETKDKDLLAYAKANNPELK